MSDWSGWMDVWRGLGGRERRLVVIGGVALFVALFYAMVWSPFIEGLGHARQRVAAGVEAVTWMQGRATEAKRLLAALGGGETPIPAGSLLSFVQESASKSGVGTALKGVEPTGNDQALVRFEQAHFHALVAWLIELHSRGVEPSSVTLEREQEPGKVRARLVLGRRGG
ncbi:MAG: type II secretion system protein M [Magnetococcales bacterium]|nr:type II secretion system protein M [Magnetococcales bacterium]